GELVLLAVDLKHDATAVDERDLAAARLVHRRVAGAAGDGAGRELVTGEFKALAGQGRREDLEGVAAGAAAGPPVAGAHDGHHPTLIQTQQLAEPQLEAGRDLRGDLQRRARLPTLD